MLRIDLRKTKYLAVGELTAYLFGHRIQILNLLFTQRQSFLFIIHSDIVNLPDWIRLLVDRENSLIKAFIKGLKHRIIIRRFLPNRHKLLHPDNSGNGHILRNLHGIGAPRGDHLPARADKTARQRFAVKTGGPAQEPQELLNIRRHQ